MRKNKFLMDLSLLLYLVTAFFYFLLGNGYVWLIISIIPISLYVINAVISMDKENYGWVIFIVFLWVSAMVSVHTTLSYKYLLIIGISFLGKLIFESVYGWHLKFAGIVKCFSFIHVFFVILSYYMPTFVKGIVDKLYTGEALDAYTQLFEREAYAGITGQTSFAGFFSAIFIAFSISELLNTKKRVWSIFKIVIGFFALFLTMKRTYLVACVIAFVFVLYIHNRGNGRFYKNLLVYTIIGIIAYYVFADYSFISKLFSKSTILLESGDITNGRLYLWTETYKLWLEKPIFGHGINVLAGYYGLSTHNSYLQVLAEAGVFGFLSLITTLIFSLKTSCSIYKEILKDNLLINKEKSVFLTCIFMQVVFVIYCFSGNPLYGITFLLIDMLFISCIKSFLQRKN